VLTKAKSTMAVVTVEDLQGTLEVVVFPKTWEVTAGTWRDGAILLIAGRVDHRGDEASLLADGVWDWDAVAERGDEAPAWFAREVGTMDKRGPRRAAGEGGGRSPGSGNGNGSNGNGAGGHGNGTGHPAPSAFPRPAAAGGPGPGTPATPGTALHPAPSGMSALPPLAPAEPMPTYAEPPGVTPADTARTDDAADTALPDEARSAAAAAAQAPSRPIEAAPGAVLNVHFAHDAATDRVVSAMQAFKGLLRERPGSTRVVVHIPAPGGSALPMELRGVAYDAELEAEVRRRVGDGIVDLRLA
jgi:hypothetical protein